ncbi:alpha/beta fold hydrolase [Microbulbifer harenosus]|uniref:Alpha/beta hydrolase n=1 Tax=Microbulbifer harenosus TaxID=2576840 RepID=A0ABY2UHJ3_9GAMM|nr:alpha/beta hydrolase [Microbulbifer harenosus]TLM76187.1 alpha/beta hydrolase [Microbulbifer harenosus]
MNNQTESTQPNKLYRSAVIDLQSIRTRYDQFGHDADPAVLLVHGLGAQRIAWHDDFCASLSDQGYRVIRFDNRDIGQASRFDALGPPNLLWILLASKIGLPCRAPYTLRDMARDCIDLLDTLGIDRCFLMGASMGGMIAQHLADLAPERIFKLVCIMSSSGRKGLPGPEKAVRKLLLSAPTSPGKQARITHDLAFWKLIASKRYPPDPDELRDFVVTSVERDHPNLHGVERQFCAILADGSRTEILAGLQLPCLVIHGDEDRLIPPACGWDVANTIPNARYLLVEGMGHDLPSALHQNLVAHIHAFFEQE